MKTSTKIVLSALLLLTIVVWLSFLSVSGSDNLKIVFCNVGQGDGILITKGKIQVIVDGGPNNKISDCISKHIPFWDRKIELVILTHPHSDHFMGLIKIFDEYEVKNYLFNDINLTSTKSYNLLKEKVEKENSNLISPVVGNYFKFGMVELKILAAGQSAANLNDLNSYSIVNKLTYNSFTVLLTGDIQEKESDNLSQNKEIENIKVLKLPHHGSDHGATDNLINKTKPETSIISVGKNSYGHPNPEIIDELKKIHTKIIRTDEAGDIVITTNGLWYTIN